MNLGEFVKNLFYIANKDQSGSRLTPEDLNGGLFELCDTKIMNELLGIKSPITQITSQVLVEINQAVTDKAKRFKVIMGSGVSVPLQVQNGIAQIPTDYLYPSSLSYSDGSKIRTIEVLNDASFESRISNPLIFPRVKYPIANFQNAFIRVIPLFINRINFIYYRKPITAYFDYYISETIGIQYLLPNTTHTLLADEVAPNHPTVPPLGTFTSLSVELDFNEDMHPNYLNKMLELVMTNLRDVEGYKITESQKEV